jgi:hypothetical protein
MSPIYSICSTGLLLFCTYYFFIINDLNLFKNLKFLKILKTIKSTGFLLLSKEEKSRKGLKKTTLLYFRPAIKFKERRKGQALYLTSYKSPPKLLNIE